MTDRRTVHLTLDGLRRAAGLVRRATGLHVEIPEPAPPPPPRSGKHAANVHLLADALRAAAPPGRTVVDGAGIALPTADTDTAADGDGGTPLRHGDCLVPDLVVCPVGFLRSEDALLRPQDVELAVEVVAPTTDAGPGTAQRIAEAVDRYARAGTRALLVVDPRAGQARWSLHAEPISGHYWDVRRGTDEAVPLGRPFRPDRLRVDRLPRYAPR